MTSRRGGRDRASRPPRLLHGIAAALALSLLGGCSSGHSAAPEELVEIVAELDNPPVEVAIAIDRVARDCMVDAGFDLPEPRRPVSNDTDTYLGLVGVFRSSWQARHTGYVSVTVGVESTQDHYYSSLPPERQRQFDEAYFGPVGGKKIARTSQSGLVVEESTSGCLGEGRREVLGSVQDSVEWSILRNESLDPLRSDPSPLGLDERDKYQTCMKQAGYSVDGFNASTVAEQRFGQSRSIADLPADAEVEMALADMGCQQLVELMPKLRKHYAQVAGEWVSANAERLRHWHAAAAEWQARARVILAKD